MEHVDQKEYSTNHNILDQFVRTCMKQENDILVQSFLRLGCFTSTYVHTSYSHSGLEAAHENTKITDNFLVIVGGRIINTQI
jgi:hypothetical protein